jgi:hypothetical protein
MDDATYLDSTDEERLALPRPACPVCGVEALVPRIYGEVLPDDPLVRRTGAGEIDVEFAGCVIPPPPLPFWRCRRCAALVGSDGARIDDTFG